MKFLETITAFDNLVMVRIDIIKYMHCAYEDGHMIRIVSDDGDWTECFGQEEVAMIKRYKQIKSIVNEGKLK